MIKKLLLGIVSIIILIAAGLIYLGSNLDGLIKSGVEKYGTMATKATTTLEKVELSLTSGKGTLQGLTLGNPEGFNSESSLKLGLISVLIDTNQIAGTGPIVIKEISIDAPALTYEAKKDGTSNLQKIQENLQTFVSSLSNGKTPEQVKDASSSEPAKAEDARKIIVEHLIITNGNVKLSHELLVGKDLLDAKLPTIEMRDIGKNSAGVTAAQLTQTILQKLTAKAMEVGQASLVKELGNQGIESLKGAVEQSGVGKALGTIFGQ